MHSISDLTCRVCLLEQNVLINVYDELEDLEENLSSLLESCGDIRVDKSDDLPKFLCEECTRELLIAAKFRKKCLKSRKILEHLSRSSKDSCEFEMQYEALPEITCSNRSEVEVNQNKSTFEQANSSICLEKVIDQAEEIDDMITITNETFIPIDEYSNEAKIVSVQHHSIDGIHERGHDSNGDDLLKKEIVNTIPISFICDICGAAFSRSTNLQKHIINVHNPEECYCCRNCDYCFTQESTYSKHLLNCKPFCAEDKSLHSNWSQSFNLIEDENIIEEGEEEKHKICKFCVKEFRSAFALKMHMRIHTDERPFLCQYCEKSFKTRAHLKTHTKRHTGQADYVCDICNKSFYDQSNLMVHMRSHTGERPHTCSLCNKTFARVFLLELHMRTHTKERPFSCMYCGQTFRQKCDLRNHIVLHTGLKHHPCRHCSKAYTKRSHLQQHLVKHHAIADTEQRDWHYINTQEMCDDDEKRSEANNIYRFEDIIIENEDIAEELINQVC